MEGDEEYYDLLEKAAEKKEPAHGGDENGEENGKEDDTRGKDREERDRSDRDSERSRSRGENRKRDIDRRRRSRSREGRRSRRSRSRERRRSGSRDRNDDYYGRRSSNYDRDRDRRRRDDSRGRGSRRPRRSPEQNVDPEIRKQQEEAERQKRELADFERDQRTVMAMNLPLKANERDIFEFFSAVGTVMDVKLITDRNSRKSKGIAYIELESLMDVPKVLPLNGTKFSNNTIMVKASESEKNVIFEAQQKLAQEQGVPVTTIQEQQAALLRALQNPNNPGALNHLQQLTGTTSVGASGSYNVPSNRLTATNIHQQVSEENMRELCKPFGEVESLVLKRDITGQTQTGTIVFKTADEANNAMQGLNGLLLGGLSITMAMDKNNGPLGNEGEDSKLDDIEGGGMSMNSMQRIQLMQRLSGGQAVNDQVALPNTNQSVAPAAVSAPIVKDAVPQMNGYVAPSQCLLLKNMFNPAEETDEDWDLEMKEDVADEVAKYGNVSFIHVDKVTPQGLVYIKTDTIESALSVQKALDKRYFAGRQIEAAFMEPGSFNRQFGLA